MFKIILVAVDVDDESSWERSLPVAVTLARSFDAQLNIATVVEERDTELHAHWSAIAFREIISSAEAKLAHLANGVDGVDAVGRRVVTSTIATGIVDLACEIEADLVVLASHKPGLHDHIIGANAVHVAKRASCSVLVVRD